MESVFPGAVLYFALDPTNKDIEGYNQLGIKSTVKVCVWVCGCVGVGVRKKWCLWRNFLSPAKSQIK